MTQAERLLHEDGPEFRITEWRFAPGATTGRRRHELDYVTVHVTSAKMRAIAADGSADFDVPMGRAYSNKAGLEHELINIGDDAVSLVEIEMKGGAR
jgi:beta-alanine degradation protein BauB